MHLAGYRWYALFIAALSQALVVMMPEICMSVLFKEISADLNLSLVQIGTIWGMPQLGSTFFLIVGGILCDRFGVKQVVTLACFMAGIAGALRGFSNGFGGLIITSFFVGLMTAVVPIGLNKRNQNLFPDKLGLATSANHTGSGIGSALAAILSASILSPWIGGWRNVIFLYGMVTIMIGFLWLFTTRADEPEKSSKTQLGISILKSLSKIAHYKMIWLIGAVLFCHTGSILATVGYLPLFLRNKGWDAVQADGVLTVLLLAGTVAAIPMGIISDRVGNRKKMLIPTLLLSTVFLAGLSILSSGIVWFIAILLGVCRIGASMLLLTICIESLGGETEYTGATVGLYFTLGRLGPFVAAPLGNSFASFYAGMPFLIWSMLSLAGAGVLVFFVRETRSEDSQRGVQPMGREPWG